MEGQLPKDLCARTPGTWEYVTSHGKGDFVDVILIMSQGPIKSQRLFKADNAPWLEPGNTTGPKEKAERCKEGEGLRRVSGVKTEGTMSVGCRRLFDAELASG